MQKLAKMGLKTTYDLNYDTPRGKHRRRPLKQWLTLDVAPEEQVTKPATDKDDSKLKSFLNQREYLPTTDIAVRLP